MFLAGNVVQRSHSDERKLSRGMMLNSKIVGPDSEIFYRSGRQWLEAPLWSSRAVL